MERIDFPADVCADPGARYHRTLNSAFPCGAREAVSIHRQARRARRGRWLALIVATALLAMLALAARGEAPADSPTARELKVAAAGMRACPGMHAEWINDSTVQCLKEHAE